MENLYHFIIKKTIFPVNRREHCQLFRSFIVTRCVTLYNSAGLSMLRRGKSAKILRTKGFFSVYQFSDFTGVSLENIYSK